MKKAIQQLLRMMQTPSSAADKKTEPTGEVQRHYAARSPAQLMGERGELIARQYLEQRGLRYVDGNVASKLGEIDLIMRDGATLVFIEVKMRRSETYGGALAAITPSKLARLRKAITLYLQQHAEYGNADCRMDALLIQNAGRERMIEWLKNIDAD